MYRYNEQFYKYLGCFAERSAGVVVPQLLSVLEINSVADFGCGQGAWLSVWQSAPALVLGVDGPYVDRDKLKIHSSDFRAADLAEPIDLGRRFDLVQSLEVAEHLPAGKAEQFVATLTAHGSCVLFSAAVPGQGGENHINERPLEYWRALFARRGFVAVDYLRPLLVDKAAVEPSYRYNIMLYVEEGRLAALPARLRDCRVDPTVPLADYRPLANRLRNALVRRLPVGTVNRLSRLKARLAAPAAR